MANDFGTCFPFAWKRRFLMKIMEGKHNTDLQVLQGDNKITKANNKDVIDELAKRHEETLKNLKRRWPLGVKDPMDTVTDGDECNELVTMGVDPGGRNLEVPLVHIDMEVAGPGIQYCLAAENALSNELIATEILQSFGKVKDLKVIRMINPVFYRLATKIMAPFSVLKSSRMEYMKMKLKHEGVSAPGVFDTYYHKYLVFAQLNSLLRNSQSLPFEAICIHSYMWDLKNPEVVEFFKRFGKSIKTVIFGGATRVNDLREYLLVRVNHAEEVIIDEGFSLKLVGGRGSNEAHLFRNRREKVQLPKLKVIRFRRYSQTSSVIFNRDFMEDLIDAAVNLELVDGCFPALFPAVVTAAKATAVKTLEFSYEHFPYIDIFVASGTSSVKCLSIKPVPIIYNERARMLLTKVFEISQEYLETILFDPAVKSMMFNIELPVLKGIRNLNLIHLFRFFRDWISTSTAATIFPNVSTVVVDGDCLTLTSHFQTRRLHEDNDYFVQTMPSVKVLVLNGGMFEESSLQFLGSKFPNLTKIKVEFTGQLHRKMYKLWNLPKQVETLVLTGVWLEEFSKFRLDEFLTGIPHDICALMQNLPIDEIDLTKFQKWCSIFSLKNLKHFTFECVDKSRKKKTWEDEKIWGIPYVSQVSRRLIFTAMPNLRLTFVFPQHYSQCLMTRESRGLRAIEPFAKLTIQHSILYAVATIVLRCKFCSPLMCMLWMKLFTDCWTLSSAIAQSILIPSPEVTNWGEWGPYEQCPPGSFVYGFQLTVESDQGFFGDDSALNGINLLCISPVVRRNTPEFRSRNASINGVTKISSTVGHEGNLRHAFECPDPFFANGFELRSENDQGWYDDDTAANNFKLHCTNGQAIEGDGESWGAWTGVQTCPRGLIICGIQTQVEPASNTDDSTLNNVRMGCCNQD
ncbi:unnamed protein product [Allacma fusca]|uniref:Uncharacterized protein n=1 Tax=Allacma fusca TaxID=39272 RepID=A0A8J2J802_9HEXA|nr:unnamed protein product [Allacma fusca]